MELPQEWLGFLRSQFPEKSRIRLKEAGEPDRRLTPGDIGTLQSIGEDGVFHVSWDAWNQGKKETFTKDMVVGRDNFTVLPPEPSMMKLYMPLYADIVGKNEYGDWDEEGAYTLDGHGLVEYESEILAKITQERSPEEAERGIMNWYHEPDSVNDKVQSVVLTVEEREGQLWGVAECVVRGHLKPDELETLKDMIIGQASDGIGEAFEQHEIDIGDERLYVHLWGADGWELKTELDCFGPDFAEGLPEMCFTVNEATGALQCIGRGNSRFIRSELDTWDTEKNQAIAKAENKKLGVTPAQRKAMEFGYKYGWKKPEADPKFYENPKAKETQKKAKGQAR